MACTLALVAGADTPPLAAAARTAEGVEQCVRDNLPDDSSVQTIVMTQVDRVGAETRMEARIYWQKDKAGLSRILLRFADPPDLRGSAVLMLEGRNGENDLFMYLPELRRTRRITSHMMSGSMFGTDFTYEEFERIQGLSEDVESRLLEPGEEAGRPVWTVESRPHEKSSGYARVVSRIDQATCVPLRIEFFEKHNEPRKRLTIDPAALEQHDATWVPRTMRMEDLRDGTSTVIRVEEIALHQRIPRKMFSQTELEKGH